MIIDMRGIVRKFWVGRKPWIVVGALAIGSVPGFSLSFVVLARLAGAQADVFAVALGTANVLASVFSSTYEAAMVAAFGRLLLAKPVPAASDFRTGALRGALLSAPLSALLFPVMLGVYAFGGVHGQSYFEVLSAIWPLALYPAVASQSAVYVGFLTSSRHLSIQYLLVAFRGLPTIAALSFTFNLFLLASTYLFGECLRLIALRLITLILIRRKLEALPLGASEKRHVSLETPVWREWWHQVSAMGVSLLSSIVPRLLLIGGQAGWLARSESAERVLLAGNQVAMSAFVLPSVARLPQKLFLSKAPVGQILKRELARQFVSSAVLTLVGATFVLTALSVAGAKLPRPWIGALEWSLILLLAVPLMSVSAWCSRVVILARLTRFLPVVSVSVLVGSMLGYVLLFHVAGGVGVIVGTVVSYFLSSIAYLLVFRRRLSAAVLRERALVSSLAAS